MGRPIKPGLSVSVIAVCIRPLADGLEVVLAMGPFGPWARVSDGVIKECRPQGDPKRRLFRAMTWEARGIYESRVGNRTRTFHAPLCLAAMFSHVPGKDEQLVRYSGYYINVCRGKRKAIGEDDSEDLRGGSLDLPQMQRSHAEPAFIEDQEVIRKIFLISIDTGGSAPWCRDERVSGSTGSC